MSNGIGHVWAVNAEGGDEGRPNGVGPVWIENADQLGSKLPEPESGDTGKVLGVLNSDGDIGWVIDQSGTFTQVQADWDQADSSQVSYIANKPSLATVATSGSYTDLSNTPTIPTVDQEYNSASANAQSGVAVAGAISGVRQVPSTSSGDNGKVLGVTDSAGTLGWVAKGEADLFYVTYNVTTFDEIKTAYDAGKWPVLIDSHGHVCPMTDYGWIGTASSLQYAYFQNNSYVPHADTTGADYENEVYILELEIDPYMHRIETWSTTWNFSSADWNASSGPRAIRNKPTVDQNYNASSTNAQSGTAVAQAIAGASGGGSSTSAFDTTFNLVPDSSGGYAWRLSNSSSYFIDLTGGAGVYAYRVVAEITDSSNPTVIDDIYKVTVCVGRIIGSETKTIYLKSDTEGYPEDPATISFNASGIIDISSAQHVRGMNVYVSIIPAKGASGTAVTTFTGGSVTLSLAKLSTLSGGWQPES